VSGETVVVADRSAAVRSGTRMALEQEGFAVVAEAADLPSALDAVRAEQPTLCLLDVRLTHGGARALPEVGRLSPKTTVVVLADRIDEVQMLTLLREGAAGYLPKHTSAERLGATLRGVLRGEAALPRDLVGRIVAELRRRPEETSVSVPGRQRVSLTQRESEVLEMLRDGLSTKEIARRLGLAAVTVRRHVAAIVRKLDVPNRAAALDLLSRSDR
jgi:DNA-binding NarL/FixJ family response regulator